MTNPKKRENAVIVTGAAGQIGRALRLIWGQGDWPRPVLWSARQAGQGIDIPWNIGAEPAPDLPHGAIILHLAGQTTGTGAKLAENRQSAAALCLKAQQITAQHVFLMSSAAVYRPGPDPIDEDTHPDPPSDYGRAKLEAETALRPLGPRLTILRLGNLAGADALLTAARYGPVTLDPIEGQPAGPERSYIGPRILADVLRQLIDLAAEGTSLPPVLNLAQPPAVGMADLLSAGAADWKFGPPRPAATPRVALSTARLQALVALPPATPQGIIADLASLQGRWP